MSYRTAAIAAAFAAAAASAIAPAADRAPASSGEANAAAKDRGSAPKRYCINRSVTGDAAITGSIISSRDCRTRAQWEAKGVSLPKD